MSHTPAADRFSVVLPEWMNRDDALKALLYVRSFEPRAYEQALEHAREAKTEKAAAVRACMNCGETETATRPLMAVKITERGAERTDYYCADVRACYRRAHRPPCVECGGAYPGHQLACSLRPAAVPQ